MKFFNKFFKKIKGERNSDSQQLSKNNSHNQQKKYTIEDLDNELDNLESLTDSILTLPADEEPTEEQLEALFKINKDLKYSEKISLMIETFQLGFEPAVELKSVSSRIGKINLETRGEYKYKFVSSPMGQVFLEIANYNIGEVIEAIRIKGSPDVLIGLGGSAFIRSEMFKLALQIVGNDNSIAIFRDDLGYQRVEYTKDDLKRYISSH